ncbi:TonB-dependent receptor [Desulfosarcina sp. BuS5]|uniref:TonB-dependent receptor n=1 Tax=Desulfosarcina sp. BuS5 TaxID=933262 RepID=UPI0018DCCF75|nr:TonB-dependent receptor [Desulfosarcina sp. BuS5]
MKPATIDKELRITTQNDQDAYGGTLQLDWIPLEKHYLITGLDVVLDYLDADQRQFDTTTTSFPFPVTTVTDDLFNDEANMKTYALYAQDEWNIINDFVLTAGLRYTWVDSELEETNDPGLTEESSDDTNLTGSLGLVYSGIDNLALRTLYSQGYRYPNLLQLFIGTVHGSSDPTFANPDLDPETSDNFEVGVRFDNKEFLLDLTGFYSSADDYITTVVVTGGDKYDNVDEATTYGVEMLAQYTFESVGITPYINGTWIRRKFETDAGPTKDTGLPDLNGRFGLRYEKNLEIIPALWGDLFVRAASDADKEDLSDGTVEHFDGWGTLNLALGVDLGKRSQYKLSLELNNLLDKEYTHATESLMAAERHVVVKLSATF